MTATIKAYGMLKTYLGGQKETGVEHGLTVRQALAALGIPSELVAFVIVNDEQQNKDYCLQEGDVVKVMAVMGGG
jgi:sulfur carrier protein ThiS